MYVKEVMNMQTKRRVTISLDKEVHRECVKILTESGVKFSTFVDIVARGIIESEQKTFNDMFQGMTKRLVESTRSYRKDKLKR